jgi:DNA-binding MarR family transcriptional regulator
MASVDSDKLEEVCEAVVPGLEPEKRAAWVGFLRAHATITKGLDADLIANVGIPLSAFEVLFAVVSSDEGYLRMSDVAERAMLSPSRVSRIVTELEQRELLERTMCPSDSRVVYATITDKGRTTIAEIQELHFEGIQRRFFSALSDGEISQLAELWPRVLDATAGVGSAT